MSDITLKPCPFCGGEAELALCEWKPAVRCKSCHATVYREYSEQVGGAEVIMWNSRRPMERIVEQLEESASKEDMKCNRYFNELNVSFQHGIAIGLSRAIEIVQKEGAE